MTIGIISRMTAATLNLRRDRESRKGAKMKRLTEKYNGKNIVKSGHITFIYGTAGNRFEGEAIDKLAAYEDAEEQGLLLRLPCKEAYSQSGDNVYLIYEDEIVECVHCGLRVDPVTGKGFIALVTDEDIFPYRNPIPECDLDPTDWCDNATDVEVSEIGNTLFFTLEKAEAKLAEMEGAE